MWNTGIKSLIANTDNEYMGSTGDVRSYIYNNDIYAYTELKGVFKEKFSYLLGAGISIENINNNETIRRFIFFRPTLMLGYKINRDMNLRYSLKLKNKTPSLNDLTNITQTISLYEVYQGNPYLKPYQTYLQNLTYDYARKSTTIQLGAILSNYLNPIMDNEVRVDSDSENNPIFVYSKGNQKSFTHFEINTSITQMFMNDKLSIRVYGMMGNSNTIGNDYKADHLAFKGIFSVMYNTKNWGALVRYTTPTSLQIGEKINYHGNYLDISGHYNYRDFRFGINILNPFLKNTFNYNNILNSAVLQSSDKNYAVDESNMIYLTVSWTFNTSKQTRGYKKRTNNNDSVTGIMK